MGRLCLILALLVACNTTVADIEGPCDDLCQSLVEDCGYEAFPTFESCAQGCLYNESEGADVQSESECVAAAECNTFDIVECEHAYGPQE